MDLDRAVLSRRAAWAIELAFPNGVAVHIAPAGGAVRAELRFSAAKTETSPELPCALGRILELAVPRELVPLKPGDTLGLTVTLREGQEVLERYPAEGAFELSVSSADLEAQAWPV
jgi:hypothetical protein